MGLRGTPEQGIRPSVLALSSFMTLGCGLAIWMTFDRAPADASANRETLVERNADRRSASRTHSRSSRTRGPSSSTGGSYRHHDWGRESELARSMALHLPGPHFWRDALTQGLDGRDPQMTAMWRSFHHAAPEAGETPPLPFEPTAHRLELVDASGDVGDTPSNCDVRVLPVTSSGFSCVVRVMCDGRVLYPNANQTAGYVACEIEDGVPVRAVDDRWTASDGDPLVDVDLARGTVRVEEYDASGQPTYSATLRIQS